MILITVCVTLDLRGSLVVLTDHLVGNEVSHGCAHLPATHHLLLPNQQTMQTGILPSTWSWKETETALIAMTAKLQICPREPVRMDKGITRLEMWGKTEIRSRRKVTQDYVSCMVSKETQTSSFVHMQKGINSRLHRGLKWHWMSFWLTFFSLPRHHRTPVAPLTNADPSPHPGFVLESWKQ